MNKEFVYDVTKEIICNQFHCDFNEIISSASFRYDFGADSLDILEITTCLEHKFNITIDVDEIVDINTVEDMVNLVMSKL